MTESLHPLLKRQLRKRFGDSESLSSEQRALLMDIDAAYRQFDADRILLERSLELTSKELIQVNSDAFAALGASEGLWDWNLQNGEITYSQRWKATLGHSDDAIGNSPDEWFSRIHPTDVERFRADLDAHLEGHTQLFESEFRIRHADQTYRWVTARGMAVRNSSGNPYRIAGAQVDITERKAAEQQLMHDALHDPLTGLPNRSLFADRLGQSIARRKRRPDDGYAVLFLDLDRFKVVNDSLGHIVGDELLVAIGQRLQSLMRPGDTVARLGGDEFAVLLDDARESEQAIALAQRLLAALTKPLRVRGRQVFTSVSIGITVDTAGYTRPEDVLRDADTAMYRAKAQGRNRYEVFDSSMHDRALALLQQESDLRRAQTRNEFCLHYQPVVSLECGKVEGFEALLRWDRPDGTHFPDEFLPVAEETGLIVAIGRWVIEEACRQMQEWIVNYPDRAPLSISVNLSAKELREPDLSQAIEAILSKTGLSPLSLILEITEGSLLRDTEEVVATLERLRSLGMRIHLDDFGTGYSSLSYLHRFPVDALKIDRSFVSGIESEIPEIVRTVATLAGNLGIDVVAEGIETRQQFKGVRELGLEFGQGYYFSRPVGANEAERMLRMGGPWASKFRSVAGDKPLRAGRVAVA
ncbi:MAG: EAL domain-containing protein [Dehalococcoidia bacterium]